jgi:TPR repeat protein
VANELRAKIWLSQSAQNGFAEAQYLWAMLLRQDRAKNVGTAERNLRMEVEAAKMFAAAAEKGHAEAQYRLGEMYLVCITLQPISTYHIPIDVHILL